MADCGSHDASRFDLAFIGERGHFTMVRKELSLSQPKMKQSGGSARRNVHLKEESGLTQLSPVFLLHSGQRSGFKPRPTSLLALSAVM